MGKYVRRRARRSKAASRPIGWLRLWTGGSRIRSDEAPQACLRRRDEKRGRNRLVAKALGHRLPLEHLRQRCGQLSISGCHCCIADPVNSCQCIRCRIDSALRASRSSAASNPVACSNPPAARRQAIVRRHFMQAQQLSARFSSKHTFSHGSRSGRFLTSQLTFSSILDPTISACSIAIRPDENRGSRNGALPHGPTVCTEKPLGTTKRPRPPESACAIQASPAPWASSQSKIPSLRLRSSGASTTTNGSPSRSAACCASAISCSRTLASWSGSSPSTYTAQSIGPAAVRPRAHAYSESTPRIGRLRRRPLAAVRGRANPAHEPRLTQRRIHRAVIGLDQVQTRMQVRINVAVDLEIVAEPHRKQQSHRYRGGSVVRNPRRSYRPGHRLPPTRERDRRSARERSGSLARSRRA